MSTKAISKTTITLLELHSEKQIVLYNQFLFKKENLPIFEHMKRGGMCMQNYLSASFVKNNYTDNFLERYECYVKGYKTPKVGDKVRIEKAIGSGNSYCGKAGVVVSKKEHIIKVLLPVGTKDNPKEREVEFNMYETTRLPKRVKLDL